MEKEQRVPKGEEYYYIGLLNASIVVYNMKDFRNKFDNDCFESGNYFSTRKEGEEMIKKLRAVLNGAEVIEMPSEEEIKEVAENYAKTTYLEESLGGWGSGKDAFIEGVDWAKSKIVK